MLSGWWCIQSPASTHWTIVWMIEFASIYSPCANADTYHLCQPWTEPTPVFNLKEQTTSCTCKWNTRKHVAPPPCHTYATNPFQIHYHRKQVSAVTSHDRSVWLLQKLKQVVFLFGSECLLTCVTCSKESLVTEGTFIETIV